MNVTEKILRAHLVSGELVVGQEVGIRIDQTLTQDATGTMAYLQFESMGIDRAKTELSVSYVDHLPAERREEVWHRLFQARQRHLPPAPPGALRQAR